MGKNNRAQRRLLVAAGLGLVGLVTVLVALSTRGMYDADPLPGAHPTSSYQTGPPRSVSQEPTQGSAAPTPRPTVAPSTPRPTWAPSTHPQTSRERYEEIARRELEQGLIAYNPPAQARVQEDFEVTVRVQRGTATVSSSLKALPGTNPVVVEQLPVGTYMRGDLRGAGFEIQSLSESLQLLDESAEWAWRVTPTSDGQRTLRLTMVVELEDEPLSNRTFDKPIQVAVMKEAPWYRRASGLLDISGVITALVIAGILAGVKRFRWVPRKAGAEQDPAVTPGPAGEGGTPDEAAPATNGGKPSP